MTILYLIRHGEAEGNAYRRIHGQYDSLLTANGLRQVEALEKRFREIPVDGCYSSDLIRTSLTARAIYVPKQLPLHRSPAFREVGIGPWEDVPFGYLEQFETEALRVFNNDPPGWHLEGAEDYETYTGRFIRGLEEAARVHEGGTIAVFCHGSVLRGTLARLFFHDRFDSIPYCDNTAVSKLRWEGGVFTYDWLNDASHLSPEISTFARQKWWRQGDRKDFNLWFRQPEAGEALPERLNCSHTEGEWWLAMLGKSPVGVVAITEDVVQQLRLLEEHREKLLEDQLLGQAVSRLRQGGYPKLRLRQEGLDTPGLLSRYGFVREGGLWTLDIDRAGFVW